MSTARPFAPGAPRLWAIPAGRPFLKALAEALAAAFDLSARPDALADAVIYVPNRRSARALAMELHTAAGGGALLTPDIRALGDLETGEPPSGAPAALSALEPPVSEARRLGVLMAKVQEWYAERGAPLPASAALAAARELADLLDQAALAGGVDWTRLPDLVETADLAAHWQESVDFLGILTKAWPDWLAREGLMDPMARRLAAAEALAASWREVPPKAPLVIAGSTGATPASRVLMHAALALEAGSVILPGLDRGLDTPAMGVIGEAASHPQHAMVATLAELGCGLDDVADWPGSPGGDGLDDRRRLVHEALSPAELTGDWRNRLDQLAGPGGRAAFARRALNGFSLIAAADEHEEARLAALMLRAALEEPGQTAALVTPDAALSRQVAALLKRWDIDIAPSAGTPVLQTTPGAFLDALMAWWADPSGPVETAALLASPHAEMTGDAALFERLALRGVRWWRAPDELAGGLAERLSERGVDAETIEAVCAQARQLARIAGGLPDTDNLDVAALKEGLSHLAGAFTDGASLWRGASGEALAALLNDLLELGGMLGALPLRSWHDLMRHLAESRAVPPETAGHPRLSIWGPLESRLQSADHLVLAGLNEEVWPQRPGASAFVPTRFRPELGLPDREERMGLAAHDFAQLACAPRVTCLYANRREDSPAVASRWVWRLQTLARGALEEEADAALAPDRGETPSLWAESLVQPRRRAPADHAMPRPRPPAEHRPKRLSVTRIEALMRDPYAVYARHVLRLEPLDALDMPIGPAQLGTAVHSALERFELDGAKGGAAHLTHLLETALRRAGEPQEQIMGRRAILARTATWYCDWRAERMAGVRTVHSEVSGALELDVPGLGPFRLRATADRVEIGTDDRLSILDFKTGAPPSERQVESGLAPQMPLQALIAAEGGFKNVPAAEIAELVYLAFRADPSQRVIRGGAANSGELAARAREGLLRLLARYADADQPYLSAPRVQFIGHDLGYNRLARRAEWSSEVADE